jgi:signal transduction histidine kinase
MNDDVLIISTLDGAANCARLVSQQVGAPVEVACDRRAALLTLRRSRFGVVVVEESMVESDPEWADQVWQLAELAVPVQVNFAISGCARLSREVRAALLRRKGEHAVARRAAVAEVENELKSTITGLLLASELVLREPAMPAALEPKVRHLLELAGTLRERLRSAPHQAA